MKELLRIYNVLNLFESKEECSQEEIRKAISLDEPNLVSYETWNRLRKKMQADYGFIVTYNKEYDTSSICFDKKIDKDKLMGLIDHFKTMELLQSYLSQDKTMIECLEFEQKAVIASETYFNVLQNAMLQNKAVLLTYKGYAESKPKEIHVNPLYFKQYCSRWYLIA